MQPLKYVTVQLHKFVVVLYLNYCIACKHVGDQTTLTTQIPLFCCLPAFVNRYGEKNIIINERNPCGEEYNFHVLDKFILSIKYRQSI